MRTGVETVAEADGGQSAGGAVASLATRRAGEVERQGDVIFFEPFDRI